jgi:protease-4
MINDTYEQFFDALKQRYRDMPEMALRIYADGRVFTGNQARKLGLVDELGGEEKAKEVLIQLTGDKDLKLLPAKINNLFEIISFTGIDGKLGLNKIEEITTPRVSYLWTAAL